jgi:hypothetical protein
VAGKNVEGDNVDLGGYGPTQLEFHLQIDDPHYLKLATKSKVSMYEGCALSRLIGTLMILNTCATHQVALMDLWMNFILVEKLYASTTQQFA